MKGFGYVRMVRAYFCRPEKLHGLARAYGGDDSMILANEEAGKRESKFRKRNVV